MMTFVEDRIQVWRAQAKRCDEAVEYSQRVYSLSKQFARHTREEQDRLIILNTKAAEVLRQCADELEEAMAKDAAA